MPVVEARREIWNVTWRFLTWNQVRHDDLGVPPVKGESQKGFVPDKATGKEGMDPKVPYGDDTAHAK